jgi:hypothetical protein
VTTAEALLDGDALPWTDTVRQLTGTGPFWLSTTGPGGGPRTRPVLAVWVDDVPHVATSPSSDKARHLADNPRCSLAGSVGGLDVVVEGRAAVVRERAALDAVAAAYSEDYGWVVEVRDGAIWADGAPTAGPPPYLVYRVRPSVAFAFGTVEATMARSTRWAWPEEAR